jgi:endonuclease YncB( thermonuclease family)
VRHLGYVVLALLGIAIVLLVVGQRMMRTEPPEIQRFAEQTQPQVVPSQEVRVIDGDTIAIGGEKIRLFGIDAPEEKQICSYEGRPARCGQDATNHLHSLIGAGQVSCEGEERDRYGRLLAICSIDGVDLGQQMVSSGWAVAFREYSDHYVPDENAARIAKRGLWQGQFELPSEWRAKR